MKTFRVGFSLILAIVLVIGYAASQYAAFRGVTPDYAASVDKPAIRLLCLAALLVAVVLAFIPDPTVDEQEKRDE